jgi:hypothetical protein
MKRDFSRNKGQTPQFRKLETRNNNRMLVLTGLLISLTLLLPSCVSFDHVVHTKPSGMTFGEKVPLNVGHYIPAKFEEYSVHKHDSFIGSYYYPDLGITSAVQFKLALGQLFRKVETIRDIPYAKKEAKGLDVVIELQIDKSYFYNPPFNWQVRRASITYKITLYDSNWNVLFTRFVEGIGETKGRGYNKLSVAASKAIEEGVKKAIDTILTSEEIKTLLKR